MKSLSVALALAVAGSPMAYAQAPTSPHLISHAADVAAIPVALWMEDGKPKIARGADGVSAAPKSAAVVHTKIHKLGGTTIREATFPAGATFSPPGGPTDTVMYILRGRMKVTMGDVSDEVGPGDTLREVSGVLSVFEVLDEVVAIETNIPTDATP